MASTTAAKNLHKFFVGNIPWTVSTLELKKYFSQFGHISSASVIFNRDTGMSKNYGFIEVTDKNTYDLITNTRAYKLEGKTLTVRPSID